MRIFFQLLSCLKVVFYAGCHAHVLRLVLDASPPENLPVCAALPTAVAVPAGARDQDEVGRRNSVGKAKGKGKKSDNSPPAESDLEVICLLNSAGYN